MAANNNQSRYKIPGSKSSLGGLLNGLLPGSKINWEVEGRDAWKNSAVAACLWVVCDAFPEAPLVIKKKDAKGQEVIVPDHPLIELLRNPQAWLVGGAAMPALLLRQATALSLRVDGNAYWRMRRNSIGMPIGFEYIPHWYIEPKWVDDTEQVSWYEMLTASGEKQRIRVEDVVHFRHGIDPQNVRKGLSRLKMVLREVVTDNEAATYSAAVLKNMGVPGVVVMAKRQPGDDEAPTMTAAAIQKIKDLFGAMTRGDKRGQTVVLSDEYELKFPGFSPEELVLDKVRSVPEARICAAIGVPAMVAGLNVGNDQRTYSNMAEAREMFTENTLVPMWILEEETLTVQVLRQLDDDASIYVSHDFSKVRALQEDENKKWERLGNGYKNGFIKRGEVRQGLGYVVDEAEDNIYYTAPTAGNEPDADKDPADDGKKPKPTSSKPDKKTAWEMWSEAIAEKRLAAERGTAHA